VTVLNHPVASLLTRSLHLAEQANLDLRNRHGPDGRASLTFVERTPNRTGAQAQVDTCLGEPSDKISSWG